MNTFEAPMLFIIGFMVVFLFGGLTGIILASPPLDFAVSDSDFLVAHFHYVLFGTVHGDQLVVLLIGHDVVIGPRGEENPCS